MAEKAESYAKMKGQEKSQFTRQVYKMMGSAKSDLMFKLRRIKDPEEKGKEMARGSQEPRREMNHVHRP